MGKKMCIPMMEVGVDVPTGWKYEKGKPHTCGRCGVNFKTKRECWTHMDFECPKRQNKGQA